ncbi:bifunctional lysylphosphatidylglycerol flippase/synthetase MprF [Luteolibacter flavescens]|uniref:Bifunctional lysylphosphatidylglycerol flippase/synthetase MprF n=1 Tax=Luteolibacter flavescens TaxID=1859460 RepID=A0ABT3FMX4_9BACT|nr:bifunctional lysylphosphatidylglycerol flippase/synthetase MprF [Luteolibacter flavescens]MCW1884335.1 bifunctional lysylphosphatidylglycerol flippase/synthetase MprF [Luteolibacter flavescens]
MDPRDPTLTPEPDEIEAAPPPLWRARLARIGAMLWVLLCAWALYGLHKEWSGFHLSDLDDALARIGPSHLAMALGFTVLSYAANAALSLLAERWLGHPLRRPWRDLAVAFISSAFSMNAGGTVLGGGSIRMRFAASQGLSVPEVGKIMMFGGLAGWAGHLFLCGALLTFAAPPVEWLPTGAARGIGIVLMIVPLIGIFVGKLWRKGWPSPALALLTLAVSIIDWLGAGLAMWALFPDGMPIDAASFVAVVVIAQAVAAFTHVPGGVGVLELTITKAVGTAIAAPVLAGALVTYRILYYLLPFFSAILLLGIREMRLRRTVLKKGGTLVMRGWSMVAPRLASLLALGGGFMLLLSANTPMEPARRDGMADWVPLPFVEGSHFMSSLAGALLILLARGLQRRVQAAWWLTVVLMAAAIPFSLVKGFDWEEAVVLSVMLGFLLPFRGYFHRHAPLWTQRFTFGWWLMLLSLAGVALWLGFFSARHVPYERGLWWDFTLDGDVPRFMRAAVGAGCVFILIALAQALRPGRPRELVRTDPQVIERLVHESSHTYAALAFLGDKEFSVSTDGRSGLMHADQGRSRIVMGDPIGDTEEADDLLWRFVEQAQDEGRRPVFYQVSVAEMPRLVDMGFKLFKLGEEARVPLAGFTMEGGDAKKLRKARGRFQRDGLTFEIWPVEKVAAELGTLRAVSDAWLGEHKAGEKGFSLGRFDDDYMKRFSCAVVRDAAGKVIAFTNLWETVDKSELSVDLMRSLPEGHGVMEAVFIELMLWGREQGYAWFNLGMAPLSGLSTHALAPLWHRLAARIFHRGESFYNFQGLRAFKDKFDPEWQPRYIAVPSAWSLPPALLDATALIGGGIRKTLSKS